MFKIILLAILLLAVISLFMALASLVRNQGASGKTVKMLSYRVGFSILLLLFLGLSKYMGWVQPHDLKGQPSTHAAISSSVEPKVEADVKAETQKNVEPK